MKAPILKDGQIYNTIITTERHRKYGSCEPSDFGSLELIRLSPEQKKLVVRFKTYSDDPATEFIEYRGTIYQKMNQRSGMAGMSREEEAVWQKKQGKFSDKSALALMLELRKRNESHYSSLNTSSYILIGNTLYVDYCKKKELTITVASNLLFSCWLSIDFECHGGKQPFKLNKASFEKVFEAQKKRFEQAKPKKGKRVGDGHVNFSYPKEITWGTDYLK